MDIAQTLSEVAGGPLGEIIGVYERKKALLIPYLHRIQEEYGFLPRHIMEELSTLLAIPLSEIYGVASFYRQFHFAPRGRVIVRVCTGTACHVRGASALLAAVKEHYKICVGETTQDMGITLETVGCVGCCGLAPVVTINDNVAGEIGSGELIERVADMEKTLQPLGGHRA